MISIIIPTCPGSEEILEKCISSIIKNTPEKNYNIIIIKNNFIGFAKAINEGLRRTKEDIILLNDDTVVVEGWINDIIETSKEYDIVGQKGYMRPEHFPFWGVYIKRKVIDKVGLLDERFITGEWEDVDYCIRTIDAGFKLGETKYLRILHLHPSTTLRSIKSKIPKEKQEKIKLNKQIFLDKWKGTKWEKRITGEKW
ncbi:glycosyltransferase [Candidatus Pacearchaeota archaeon]|nr:glycosyltransferase [Candidatus Pacearchaeota archaeon]